ncbi:hypothetical protein MIND_00687000 [Mycena indigotica]|uniref:Complex 1 LYR protein domain-containing protein n=1 Tax=Mycena indigotica TaxID=2126181 RepID=A0A8H6SLW2_9AGAR|nr:uncharacterized protein MIND_00687000 [Mycena indigotica]KAF7301222.1 hypothetical protein MIND_00687000 [Mycena indigotica]
MAASPSIIPASSLAFRANLAKLISPLRRVRPRVPFFQLTIHRLPTLALYRNLLRYAPDNHIQTRMRFLFRKNQHLTGTEKTKRQLEKGYKFLAAFKRAHEGDEKQQLILSRYSRLLAAKAEKHYWKGLVRAEVAWQERLKSRPILTGGLMKATYFNPPLPRMKPQPMQISKIIMARKRVRDRRWALREQLIDHSNLIFEEQRFEQGLLGMGENFESVFDTQWQAPIKKSLDQLNTLNRRDIRRSETPVSPELEATLLAARREKIANKTRERARERAGEVLPITLERQRGRPPGHIFSRMTPKQKHRDRVLRGVGEVGYVGMMKQRMNFKLRDGGKGLARENSVDLEGERLEAMQGLEKAFKVEQRRRQGEDYKTESR